MKLVITQNRSGIGRSKKQQDTVRALGIRHVNQTVTHDDSPQIRGMIARVSHLLRVSEQSA